MKYFVHQAWLAFQILAIVVVTFLALYVVWGTSEYTLPERLLMFVVLWAAFHRLEELQK